MYGRGRYGVVGEGWEMYRWFAFPSSPCSFAHGRVTVRRHVWRVKFTAYFISQLASGCIFMKS